MLHLVKLKLLLTIQIICLKNRYKLVAFTYYVINCIHRLKLYIVIITICFKIINYYFFFYSILITLCLVQLNAHKIKNYYGYYYALSIFRYNYNFFNNPIFKFKC